MPDAYGYPLTARGVEAAHVLLERLSDPAVSYDSDGDASSWAWHPMTEDEHASAQWDVASCAWTGVRSVLRGFVWSVWLRIRGCT